MVMNRSEFDSEFERNARNRVAVNKNHTFDSRQTVITVGPNNMRYPFDTEEAIFRLSSMNDACYTTQRNGKIKPTLVKQDACGVCRKPKDKFKNKIIQCHFCAMFGCSDCIGKLFPFPQLDPEDHTQNLGVICMVCEAKLNINTVTSDILRALGKAELRAEQREMRIEEVTKEQAQIEN